MPGEARFEKRAMASPDCGRKMQGWGSGGDPAQEERQDWKTGTQRQ